MVAVFARLLFNKRCFSFISHKRLGKNGFFCQLTRPKMTFIFGSNFSRFQDSFPMDLQTKIPPLFWVPKGSSRVEARSSPPLEEIAVIFTQTSNQGCVKNANSLQQSAGLSDSRHKSETKVLLLEGAHTGNCNSLGFSMMMIIKNLLGLLLLNFHPTTGFFKGFDIQSALGTKGICAMPWRLSSCKQQRRFIETKLIEVIIFRSCRKQKRVIFSTLAFMVCRLCLVITFQQLCKHSRIYCLRAAYTQKRVKGTRRQYRRKASPKLIEQENGAHTGPVDAKSTKKLKN